MGHVICQGVAVHGHCGAVTDTGMDEILWLLVFAAVDLLGHRRNPVPQTAAFQKVSLELIV